MMIFGDGWKFGNGKSELGKAVNLKFLAQVLIA